jgi:7-carboxy-7-deazaguanine synthase
MPITYPISEVFTSPQGEGVYCGTYMSFIRLAGCSVGRRYPKQEYLENALPIYTEMCTTYDGRTFQCDTDYRRKSILSLDQIMEEVPRGIRHVCITGGEPFIHELSPLVAAIEQRGAKAHIETSGTVPLCRAFSPIEDDKENPYSKDVWITVSPKHGILDEMVHRADEIKLLVDDDFDIKAVPASVRHHPVVYIQPINFENTINQRNLKTCMALQKIHPNWRVSLQLHKVLSHYLGELVR